MSRKVNQIGIEVRCLACDERFLDSTGHDCARTMNTKEAFLVIKTILYPFTLENPTVLRAFKKIEQVLKRLEECLK